MTTIDNTAEHIHEGHHGSYLTPAKGGPLAVLIQWAFTVDHKKICVMYIGLILTCFFVAGMAALAVRTELWEPTRTIVNDAGVKETVGQLFHSSEGVSKGYELYNRMFTTHGAMMVFLVAVPLIPATLGNFLLPLMLGAKDVAFPRLNLLSWYVFLAGAIFAVLSLINSGVDTGWTFYTPYSSTHANNEYGNVVLMIFAAFILGFSSILTGLNFIVTIHKLRCPGMGWFDMPLFCWAIYATSIIQVLATPVIGITLLLLIFERVFHVGIFDPAMGGDPVLFQHFFWFYSHPVVYVMILPGMGVVTEIIAVHARKPIFGYKAIAFASLGIAGASFLIWGHHMFTAIGEMAAAIFSFLTFFVAIPTAIKIFNWIVTLYKGSIAINTAMMYALAFLFLFLIGGLTGLPLATLATDLHLHDSYFVVAHFHYTMMGGSVIAFLGGIHHWWPKITGKMYNEKLGLLGFALVFIGFNVTFFTQFFLGTQGMPRRYASYIDEFQTLHQISTIGSYILATGMFVHLINWIHSLIAGPKAPANAWGGLSLEWYADSPPDEHNFPHEPVVTHGPYDYHDIVPPHTKPGEWGLPEPLPEGAAAH